VIRIVHTSPAIPVPVLDLETVVTVLYIGMFTPDDWRRLGPAAMADLVAHAAGDPRTRLKELSELVAIGRRVGFPRHLAERLAAADEYAPTVLAAAAAAAAAGR
jgi:hypothetical protein